MKSFLKRPQFINQAFGRSKQEQAALEAARLAQEQEALRTAGAARLAQEQEALKVTEAAKEAKAAADEAAFAALLEAAQDPNSGFLERLTQQQQKFEVKLQDKKGKALKLLETIDERKPLVKFSDPDLPPIKPQVPVMKAQQSK